MNPGTLGISFVSAAIFAEMLHRAYLHIQPKLQLLIAALGG